MSHRRRELTPIAVILGLLLSVVMGAANVYLGLKVGMTVSASIPAAVIAMAVLNGLMGRTSVLEANLVQTSASAGESLAAGIIFTMPALILTEIWSEFDFLTTSLIALSGGLLGILLMIPMRRVFVVDEPDLQFPEGVACAEVLRTAERSNDTTSNRTGARTIFAGLAVGAGFKLVQSYLGLLRGTVEWATVHSGRVFYFGTDAAPLLIGVGAIVGLPIAAQIFTGGVIGWLISMPLLSVEADSTGSAVELAYELWSTQIRYLGVGAMLVGGAASIWQVRFGLVTAVRELAAQFGTGKEKTDLAETERNIGTGPLVLLSFLTVALIAGLYYSLLASVGITFVTTAIMLVMAFFFTAVASYIVGLVGNSNSPVSGMTITAVLGTAGLIALFNATGLLEAKGNTAILATLCVAGIVCCVACTAGDVCNDLKTGYLIGASPRLQQMMQVGGVVAAAFVMAPVMTVLHKGSIASGGTGIGGKELSAPQARLFAGLVEGFFGDGELPWEMIAYGAGIGVAILLTDAVLRFLQIDFRLHVMPVAVGIYLPFGIAPPILLGGLMHQLLKRRQRDNKTGGNGQGVLVASGVIAGESLFGVLLGTIAFLGYPASWNFSERLNWSEPLVNGLSLLALLGVAVWMFRMASRDSQQAT